MTHICSKVRTTLRPRLQAVLLFASAFAGAQAADPAVTYKCPGNHYSNTIGAKEAKDKGCTALDNTPITVIQSVKPRPAASATPVASSTRVDPADQRARDTDARRILEAELKREEDRLATMKVEYNNGEPERRGDERNYQKYLDRVAETKASISRKESDIAAIKRELAKLPQ